MSPRPRPHDIPPEIWAALQQQAGGRMLRSYATLPEARAEREKVKARRKAERDRKRDQRRKDRL